MKRHYSILLLSGVCFFFIFLIHAKVKADFTGGQTGNQTGPVLVTVTKETWEWQVKPGYKNKKLIPSYHRLSGINVELSDPTNLSKTCHATTNDIAIFYDKYCPILKSAPINKNLLLHLSLSKSQQRFYFPKDSVTIQLNNGVTSYNFQAYEPVIAGHLSTPSHDLLNSIFEICLNYSGLNQASCDIKQAIRPYYLIRLDNRRLSSNNQLSIQKGPDETGTFVPPSGKTITIKRDSLNRQDLTVQTEAVLLNVPGVSQAKEGDCGVASTQMAILYSNPLYHDQLYLNRQKIGSWPEWPLHLGFGPEVFPHLTWPSTNEDTKNVGCVHERYLAKHYNVNSHELNAWYRLRQPNKYAELQDAIRSLKGINRYGICINAYVDGQCVGDPVIMFGDPGAVFAGEHVFLLVGYDPKDQTFYVNNPNIGSVQVQTKFANGHRMTIDYLQKFLGHFYPRTDLMIKEKYL